MTIILFLSPFFLLRAAFFLPQTKSYQLLRSITMDFDGVRYPVESVAKPSASSAHIPPHACVYACCVSASVVVVAVVLLARVSQADIQYDSSMSYFTIFNRYPRQARAKYDAPRHRTEHPPFSPHKTTLLPADESTGLEAVLSTSFAGRPNTTRKTK